MASIGMFVDGALYASISRNLADGSGSLWALHFSDGLFARFHEHPPLVFWLQSLFFRALGDSYMTERSYDLVVVLVSAGLMRSLWIRLVAASGRTGLAGYWWLALLCWVLVPKWSWAYRNNMLENTLTLFCLLSVWLALAGLRATGRSTALAFGAAAAAAAVLAFLCKGPVALFVLIAPLLLIPAVAGVDRRTIIRVQAGLLLVFGVLIAVLLAWPEARESLALYWRTQVLGRTGISGAGGGVLLELAGKLAPMLVVVAGAWFVSGRTRADRAVVTGPALSMLSIGLAASLPLMLGDRDSAHYFVPALPFLALGCGLIAAGMLEAGGDRYRRALEAVPSGAFRIVAAALAVAILLMAFERLGEVRKNQRYHAFLAQVDRVVGAHRTLEIDPALYPDWVLHAVAQRYYRISLAAEPRQLVWRIGPADAVAPPGYRDSGVRLRNLVLQRRVADESPTRDQPTVTRLPSRY